jgi:ATP-dependent Clp protease ATP-binding subunit ClpB
LRLEAASAESHADLSRAAELRYGKIPNLEKDLETKSKRLKKLQSSRRILKEEITSEDVAEVVSRWTGIPVVRMIEQEAHKLSRMEDFLKDRIIGQDEAVKKIADTVKRSRAGISDPNRPIGSFMFLGPTGVGKTELTKALAEFMFDDDNALIRVDMSEFMEKHSISKLIGSPPGYVGFDEGSPFVETVRHRPYSVILFDEIEKAHPEVFNILLQVFDNGRLTDAKGRVVNFKNAIIIMTSNVGADYIDKMETIGFSKGEKATYDGIKEKVLDALKTHFRPEFLNRLDNIIVFDVLTEEAIRKIVNIQIAEVKSRLTEKEINLVVSDPVVEQLGKEGYSPQYGARPLKRLIQEKVLNPLATLMIEGQVKPADTVTVTLSNGKEGTEEFKFEIKKPGKKESPYKGRSRTAVGNK